MEKRLAQLMISPLFTGISLEELPGLLECMGTRFLRLKKGQYIFREGDAPRDIGLVLSGTVRVVREDYDGNRSILARIGAGQLFGESYAFSGTPMLPVSVVAEEDCSVALLDSRRIGSSCANACAFHSRLINNFLRLVAGNNLMLHQKIRITSRRTTREKLMEYLLHQAKLAGSDTVTVPYDRQGLADYLEVDRSGLSTEIGKLRREGILECEKSTFRLLRT